MTQLLTNRRRNCQNAARATIGSVLGLLAGLGLGLTAGALWTHRATSGHPDRTTAAPDGDSQVLSEGTKAVLKRLEGPAELRLYSTIDPVTAPEELKTFARRVDQLLSIYQQESNGKVNVTRLTSLAYTNASAAAGNGIKPFVLNDGNECLLGLVVMYKGQKEPVPQLMPEWEAAMEIDITRAIQNVVNAAPASSAKAVTARNVSAATAEDLKRLIPNLESTSLAEGTRILREAALKDFGEAVKESQGQLKEAEQRLTQAQNGGSEADQQAAVKHLQEVQAAQSERLKEIAAKSRAQIDALRTMKGSGQ